MIAENNIFTKKHPKRSPKIDYIIRKNEIQTI